MIPEFLISICAKGNTIIYLHRTESFLRS